MHGSQEALGMLSPMDGAADKLLKGDLSGAVKEAAMEAGGGRVFKAAGKGLAAVKRHAGKLDEAVGALSHADDAATATATGVRESIEEGSSVLAKEGGGAANTGPGQFGRVIESMSDRAAIYQSRVTGTLPDVGYVANGVKFDGFNAGRGVLLDAKGPGYATFVKDGQFRPWYNGADSMAAQAQRQLGAAGGTPIEWHFAEEAAANATRNLFQSRGIEGISVFHSP